MHHNSSTKPRVLLFLLMILVACRPAPDLQAERDALLAIHEQQRKAHLEKNAALLLADSSNDYMEINRGFIKRPNRTESLQRFQSYFNSVDFIKWDDVTAPVFSFSDDATMATAVVDKFVVLRRKDEPSRLDTSYYAWLAVYRKRNGKWQMERMASTNR